MGKLKAAVKGAKNLAKKARDESFAYKRKLEKKLFNEDELSRPPRKSLQEKEARIKELEKDIALENPYMTYEDRVKYLGGKYVAGGVVSRGAKIIQKQISSLKDKLANNPDKISGGAAAGRKRLKELEGMSQNYSKNKKAAERSEYLRPEGERSLQRRPDMKKGGKVGMGMTKNNFKKGGKVSSCSKRADGCAVKGKTKGRMV